MGMIDRDPSRFVSVMAKIFVGTVVVLGTLLVASGLIFLLVSLWRLIIGG